MSGIATKKRIAREKQQRMLRRMDRLAKRLDRGELFDKQDEMLDGLDDGWEPIRQRIVELAGDRGEWAGYPLPDEDIRLVIEPRHPLYGTLNGFRFSSQHTQPEEEEIFEIVNVWHDYVRERIIWIFREADGQISHAAVPNYSSTDRANKIMQTLGASRAWSVRAEFTAMARLKTLVTKAAFRYYLLTGTFMETSKRSGVVYLFRKCRPTIAFGHTKGSDHVRVLCALCLHPIGYYEDTFAGSMVPTDDVIAHLMMMRGDERKFWSKSNQHDCRNSAAGV